MSKRQAGEQLTKDRHEADDDWGRDTSPDPAQEAPPDVLAKRKIAMPKSRRKGNNPEQSESPAPNPFSFGATSGQKAEPAKANPFANLASSATSSSTFGTSKAFSFGVPASTVPSVNQSADATAKDATPENKTNGSTKDTEYNDLLKYRSINVAFEKAVQESLKNDPFADLSKICDEYKSHRGASKPVPIVPASGSEETNIYPAFTNASTEAEPQSPIKENSSDAKSQDKPTPTFAFNASAPAFPSTNSSKPTFSFGAPSSKPDEAPAKDSTPKFVFGQTAKSQEDKSNSESTQAETPKKPIEGSKDFSWTPDRGIKFGDSAKTSEVKTAPTFGFNNPLPSPSQADVTEAQGTTASKPSFTFGSNATTGFSFGQSSKVSTNTESKDETSATTKTPAFSFGSSAPTFSFGQSSTPAFSFSAPKKADAAPATTTQDGGDDENDGDAMPDEPRTNDALIAGPGVGEEDEEEVYNVPRAKLFKYNADPEKKANPWTDLGICVVRVLVHKESKKARIIARAEGAGALRLNARMYPHFKYTQEGKSNVKVYEMTAEQKNETYLVKIKDPATATELVKVLNDKKA